MKICVKNIMMKIDKKYIVGTTASSTSLTDRHAIETRTGAYPETLKTTLLSISINIVNSLVLTPSL